VKIEFVHPTGSMIRAIPKRVAGRLQRDLIVDAKTLRRDLLGGLIHEYEHAAPDRRSVSLRLDGTFRSTALFDTPLLFTGFTRAREYQIRRVDVKRAQFVCWAALRSRLITLDSRAKPSLGRIELMN
jgi:hypothetical protein